MIYTSSSLSKKYKNLTLIYPNFKIKRGDICCIIGENGYGKSTLLKILAFRDSFFNGELRFLNIDARKIAKRFFYDSYYYNLYSKSFFIEQDRIFFSDLTLEDNIKLIYGKNFNFVKELILKNKVLEKDIFNQRPHRISLFKLKFLLTFLMLHSDKEIILVDELFDFEKINSVEFKNICKLAKRNNKTFIFSLAASDLTFDEIDCVIDLNKKKFYEKNDTKLINSFSKVDIKVSFDKKNIKDVLRISFKEVIFLIALVTILILFELIYLKTSIYSKYKTTYLIEELDFKRDKITSNILQNNYLIPVKIEKQFINDKYVSIFIFNEHIFKNSILKGLKLKENAKDGCILAEQIGNLPTNIKEKYVCSKEIFIKGPFLKNDLFILSVNNNVDYNSLIISSYNEKDFKNVLPFFKDKEITKISCDFNEALRELYFYLKRVKPFFYFVFAIFLILFDRILFFYRLPKIIMLLGYGVKFLDLYLVFLYNILKYFMLSLIVSFFWGYVFVKLFFLKAELNYLLSVSNRIYLLLGISFFILTVYKGFLFFKLIKIRNNNFSGYIN